MKRLFPHFAAPVALVMLSVVAGCSSDNSPPGGAAGSSPGGASASGGKGGATSNGGAGAGGASAAGAPAGGAPTGGAPAGGAPAGGSGGAGTAGSAAVATTFATVKTMIATKCSSGAGCHTEPGNPLQMPSDDKLYATVTTHVTEHCGMLVNKTAPAQSALVKILQGDCNGTPRMPFQSCADGDTDVGPDAPCIAPDQIAGIQAWIAKGAPQQ